MRDLDRAIKALKKLSPEDRSIALQASLRYTRIRAEDKIRLLTAIAADKRQSLADLARRLEWFRGDGQPNKMKVYRALNYLKKQGLVSAGRHGLKLTENSNA
jgi:predicted transcriptional regulator